MIEKILLIVVPDYTYLCIILFDNTYIFICHKKERTIGCFEEEKKLNFLGLFLLLNINIY